MVATSVPRVWLVEGSESYLMSAARSLLEHKSNNFLSCYYQYIAPHYKIINEIILPTCCFFLMTFKCLKVALHISDIK